ncbi:MAG TPA: filamentous hemagglutinin N-terminal domain-containing protein, partial [Spongiibacteraceae bacterium]
MNDTGWRKKPLARAIVISNCWLLIVSASAPLYAAPPAVNALPQAANILVNANQGAATVNTVGNTMTVNQGSNKVILNWKSFDIGKDGKVQFVQPSAQAIALNKIGDSAASQIFGQLGANGTIYLVNNNGIIFGQGSQVNVHSLLASTLNIDANQFMNSSILNAINDNKAALEGGSAANASIIVEAGAKISTDGNSGQILMFAPNVINNGEIRSPDGQTILAASQDRVYLTASDKDQDLRGILVEVDTGGNVTNVGQIVAERGNITLLGLAVNQSGRLTATTSVDVNGSIRLLARDTVSLKDTVNEKNDKTTKSLLLDDPSELPSSSHIAVATHSGTVTIGNNSTTEVIADSSSGTAADAQPQNKSRIDVMGKTIAVNSGAVVSAKSGKINLTATATPDDPESPIARNDSRLLIDSNATLDVSGENVELPMERRVVAVELRGDELKDSPLQRNGVLRGKTVNVDIATGTPLVADLSPTLAKIQKGVKERMVEGGTINLHSQGDVAFNDNATLNTAGGSITYAAGLINTTKLMTSDGRVVDIGKADPNQRYAGIFGEHSVTHFKWGKTDYGQTSALTLGTYYNSFTEGKNAGSLNIAAQALQGFDRANIQAGMQRGPTQRDITTGPAGGTVNIVLGYADKANNSIGAIQNAVIDQVGHSQAIALSDSLAPNNGELPLAYFSADKLNASGVSSFSLTSNGHIDVNENTNVRLTAGSKFALTGTSLDFNGTVRSAAGAVVLKTAAPSSAIDDAQPLTLGARSVIDVGGAWNNDALDLKNANPLAILALNGGSIDIGARGNLTVASGARLNANAGAQLTSAGVFKGGSGGNIAFTTNAGSNSDTGSRLILNGAYSAYGFGNGGKLALEANGFQIGGASNDARIVQIDPAFFARGGFSDYSLKSNLIGIDIAPQTQIAPQQQNFVVKDFNRLTTIASGGDIGSVLQLQTLPDYNRNPVSLHLNAAQAVARTTDLSAPAYLRVGSQAQINADNGATVDLISVGSIAVDGAIHARGGKINLTIEDPATGASIDRGYSATQAIWLGNHALLDAAATVERALDPTQQLIDKVFDAGAINIAAKRGFIAAAPGSVMDVSGAAYLVNLPRNAIERAGQRSVTVNAAAGAINLTAADGIAAYSTFNGHGSGDGLAGSINFTLDGGLRNEGTQASTFAFFPLEISVGENLPNWDGAIQAGSALPNTLRGKALIAADSLRSGGFGSLSLATSNRPSVNNGAVLNDYGRISFNSDVALALSDRLTLSATNINIANHNVDLSAAIVNIGRDGGQSPKSVFQNLEQTAAGTGQFNLSGKFIDVVGNVGISGAAATQLSSATDLRFRNVIDANNLKQLAAAQFTTPGDLTLRAAQIYPSTMSDYTIDLTGTDSTLTTALPAGGGTRTPILSAGGKLALMAPNIEHGGNLVAPLGTIELDATNSIHLAAGSNIDVSSNVLIPYGRLLGSDLYWTYPIVDGQPLIIDKVPQKSVVLNAPSTKMDSGATVNLSGGGDIYAFEQIPGPGGSKDFLAAENANGAFAVVPWLSSLATPFDTVEMQGFNIALGTTIWLDGANGLPAGNYAVLPAHYALLDGAYLITPKGSALPGVVAKGTAIDGTAIVTGRFGRGMSGQYASQWQSFSVETGAAARLRSEYKESTGAEFFKDDTVDLAADAGHMLISAQTALELNGSINAAAQNGRGAQLDIIADKIAVVADLAQDVGTGVVKLAASALNHLGVDSLMLGGTRTRAGDDTNVDVRSSDITVGSGAQLQAPDIILAARDHIAVQANASVQGSGTSTVNTRAFIIDGDGALLRASSAAQSNVQRSNSSGSAGDLQIATTAQLGADKSLLLDATRTMTLPNTIGLDNGSLNISANRISLGDVPAATTGVAFSNAQLNALNAQELRFSSRSSIDFFGSVNFQNRTTTLNTGALRSMQAGDARISATDTLQLQNGVNGAGSSGNANGGGNLILTAKNIVLGSEKDTASTLALDGFNAVQLGEAGQTASLRGAGEFSLLAPALTIYADNIGAASAGAKINLLASGAVALNKANAAASTSIPANNPPLGAELTIEGASIRHDTAINLPSGIVSMTATGTQATDDVALGSNANIDVSGATIALQHANINTAGGTVNLISNNASVRAEFGSSVNISGAKESGNAGTLNILAAQGSATWSGALVAQAAGSASGGNLSVDAKALDANSLITTASSAGATNSLILRARTGDIVVNEDVHAQKINISADGSNIDSPRDGALTVNSTLDASGANGGSIALYSHDDLTLNETAHLIAKGNGDATNNTGRGGIVELGSNHGNLVFNAGSAIDVSGTTLGGDVNLRALRNASNDGVAVINSGIAVTGAERVQLAAVKTYNSAVLDGNLLAQMQSDATAFFGDAAHEAQLKNNLGTLGSLDKFHLVPEFEVVSNGNLTVSNAVDFAADADANGVAHAWRFGVNGEAPVLTLRAAGDLNVEQSLSDGI